MTHYKILKIPTYLPNQQFKSLILDSSSSGQGGYKILVKIDCVVKIMKKDQVCCVLRYMQNTADILLPGFS